MDDKKNQKPSFIPYIFFIFFGIIFIVDGFFIYLAKRSWRGIATEDSYKKGINYNDTLQEVEKQKELGWKIDLRYQENGKNAAILKACVLNKNNQQIKNAKLIAKITRPTQEGYDFSQDFLPQNNCYFAKINFPLSGQWNVEIQAFKDDFVFQEVKRYVVR